MCVMVERSQPHENLRGDHPAQGKEQGQRPPGGNTLGVPRTREKPVGPQGLQTLPALLCLLLRRPRDRKPKGGRQGWCQPQERINPEDWPFNNPRAGTRHDCNLESSACLIQVENYLSIYSVLLFDPDFIIQMYSSAFSKGTI